MRLSEYIDGLKQILEKNGDLQVVYAVDEEGNSFNEIFFSPSVGYYDDNDFTNENNFEDGDYEINSVCVN